MLDRDVLPHSQSMKAGHTVRRFRRGNAEHGRAYLGRKRKPWKQQTTITTSTGSNA